MNYQRIFLLMGLWLISTCNVYAMEEIVMPKNPEQLSMKKAEVFMSCRSRSSTSCTRVLVDTSDKETVQTFFGALFMDIMIQDRFDPPLRPPYDDDYALIEHMVDKGLDINMIIDEYLAPEIKTDSQRKTPLIYLMERLGNIEHTWGWFDDHGVTKKVTSWFKSSEKTDIPQQEVVLPEEQYAHFLLRLIKLFADNGADPSRKRSDGSSAMSKACEHKYLQVVSIFKEAMANRNDS